MPPAQDRTDKFEYQRYLASRDWALLREAVRDRSDGQCERCQTAPMDAVHHLTYERIGRERLDDLLAVCDDCHEFLSGKSDHDPAAPPRWAFPRLLTDEQQALRCPRCLGTCLHFEVVHVSGRAREDGPFTEVAVYGDGAVFKSQVPGPVGSIVGTGRRDRLGLRFWCETCGEPRNKWWLVFTQHKGTTFVEVVV